MTIKYKIIRLSDGLELGYGLSQPEYKPWMGLPERTVEANSEPYTSEDVLEEIPAVMDGDEQLSPPMVRLRAQYTIEIEDITAEVAANESKKQKIESAKNDLKQVRKLLEDAKAADTNNKRDKVLVDMAKAILKISKALGLADADESET